MDSQHARESKDKERNLVTLTNLQQSILFAAVHWGHCNSGTKWDAHYRRETNNNLPYRLRVGHNIPEDE